MQKNNIEPFVNYPLFHAEQKKSFKNNAFIVQNLFYNNQKDYFVCPMGQHMEKVGNSTRKSDSGYISNATSYQAKNCTGCPLRCLCHTAILRLRSATKGNRRIEINTKLNEYRKNARELLTSEEGLLHRKRRPIEPEAVFGQTKANKQYHRFRHFHGEKVIMDFAIFAVAFNIGKMHNKAHNVSKSQKKTPLFTKNTTLFVLVIKWYIIKKLEHNVFDPWKQMAD
jgi:hypothetical protein